MHDVAFKRRVPVSNRSVRRDVGLSRDFRPEVKSLESRTLLSTVLPQRASIVWHPNPPRTGGLAVQSGSVLSCFVGQPRMNEVQVVDYGKGDVQMSWNSGQPHSFQGVTMSIIQAQRASTGLFEIEDYSFDIEQTLNIDSARASSRVENSIVVGTSGHAVQAGSLLTVTVNRPRTNVVHIINEGAGNWQVDWNGVPVHSFSGVAEINFNTRNARKDQVTLSDASA